MTRVAFLSPLPPDTSGIADYSAELLGALGTHLDIDLFTGEPEAVDGALRERFEVGAYSDFPAADRSRPYDSAVYQLGNSAAHHGEIHRLLLERPGVVVLHEYMLHHLMRDLTLERGGAAAFKEEMRYCHGDTGARMAGRILHANDLPEMWTYPLFERVVDRSHGLIVHSRATRDRVLASRPGARIAVVPHHLSLHGAAPPDPEARARFLGRHGVPEDAFVVASFGHLTQAKRLAVSLRAFARLRERFPKAVYLLVGEPSHAYTELGALLEGPLGAGVHATGRVPLAELLESMAHCDVAVNLRHPTGGETSGACLRLLGLGRPVVVTDAGWFGEIPDGCCAKLPISREGDSLEEDLLTAVLAALAADELLRRSMGRQAARWAATEHRLEDCARGYAEFIERTVAAAPDVPETVPPLAPREAGDLPSALAAALGTAAADLGLDDAEEELLPALAEAQVRIGLG